MSQQRTSMAPPPNSNLYCVSCNSQIGIFENEWVHLTSSYAWSQERGTHFGTEIGIKTQVVPEGSADRNAEGCEMSEVYCMKCSTVVAQYCRTAPEANQKHFVGQYFYKVSRVYLKDSHTSTNIEMHFIDQRPGSSHNSQKSRNGVVSSVPPRSKLPPSRAASDAPFRQSYPPPNNHSWQRSPPQAFQSQPSLSNDFRSAPVQTMSDLRSDQLGLLSECANRITATDMRLANQEMRFNTSQESFRSLEVRAGKFVDRLDIVEGDVEHMESKLEEIKGEQKELEEHIHDHDHIVENHQEKITTLRANYDELSSYFREQGTVIKEQQWKIQEQHLELRRVTAKLDGLQSILNNLKATLNQDRHRDMSTSQPSPEFFDGIVKMIKTMTGPETDSEELQALRSANDKMKMRLKTIAGAIGISPESDVDISTEDTMVLGKRKRGSDNDTEQQQKLSRTSNANLHASVQEVPSLPTPDSSQNNAPSLLDVRKRGQNNAERRSCGLDVDTGRKATLGKPESHIIHLSDNDMMEQTELETAPSSTEARENIQIPATHDDVSRVSPQHRTPVTHGNTKDEDLVRPVDTSAPTLLHNSRANPNGQNKGPQDDTVRTRSSLPLKTPALRPETSRKTSVSFASNRPVSMIERMRTPSVRNSIVPQNSLRPTVLPLSQVNSVSNTRSNLQRVETFSGGLSRGETLENLVQRPQASNTSGITGLLDQNITVNHQESHQEKPSNVKEQILRPTQASKLNTRIAGSSRPSPVDVLNAVSSTGGAEFSDFENEEFDEPDDDNGHSTTNTPTVESKNGGVLISRTVPGLTFEPLVRPVLPDEIESHTQMVSRRASVASPHASGAVPIMPEIMAAIKNLNECMVSQTPPPAPPARAPRPTRSKVSTKGSKAGQKKGANSKQPRGRASIHKELLSPTITEPSETSDVDSSGMDDNLVVVATASDIAMTGHSSANDTDHTKETIVATSNTTSPPAEEPVSLRSMQEEPSNIQSLENARSVRKSMSRSQLLTERNRLAMEAMEREEAGRNLRNVAV